MAAKLPPLARPEFDRRLGAQFRLASTPPGCRPRIAEALWRYYATLRQWSPRLSLVGEGTATEVIERHFGESLVGVAQLPGRGVLVDVGSGAGFPGLVLAAARPDLDVVMVEARQRKASFLRAAARAMGLSVDVRHDRIEIPLSQSLPEAIDCLTARAIRFDAPTWAVLVEKIAPGGSILVWAGGQAPPVSGLKLAAAAPLAGSHSRRILHYRKP